MPILIYFICFNIYFANNEEFLKIKHSQKLNEFINYTKFDNGKPVCASVCEHDDSKLQQQQGWNLVP